MNPMDTHELRRRLGHVVVTNVTPFGDDRGILYDRIGGQVNRIVAGGVGVLVPCGNTGEFSSLTDAEAKQVVEVTAREAPAEATVIAGIGGATDTAIALATHAQQVGAHAVMVHHPTHTYINREAVGRYYQRIIDAVDLGVVIYKRGPELPDEVVAELAQHDRIVAVKYAVNDVNAFANLIDRAGADACTWLCGTAERWAPFFAVAGAAGFTSGLANFAPELAVRLYDALATEDYASGMKLRRQLAPFEELRADRHNANNVPAVKEAMRVLDLDGGHVREPLSELNEADRAHVRELLRAWGLLD